MLALVRSVFLAWQSPGKMELDPTNWSPSAFAGGAATNKGGDNSVCIILHCPAQASFLRQGIVGFRDERNPVVNPEVRRG